MLERYRKSMNVDVLHSWANNAQLKIDDSNKLLIELKELKDAIFKHGIEITRLMLRVESLKRGYDEIVEIYANMEGFIPETSPEGYQQKIIRDMYEVATKYT